MNKFALGDRIVVYDMNEKYIGTIYYINGDFIKIKHEPYEITNSFHYKQCRKLIKKEPEIYWVRKENLLNYSMGTDGLSLVKVKVIK